MERGFAGVWVGAFGALIGAGFSACTMDFGALEPTGANPGDASLARDTAGQDVVVLVDSRSPVDGNTPSDTGAPDIAVDSYVYDAPPPVDAGVDVVDAGNADAADSGLCGAPGEPCCAGRQCNGSGCCDVSDCVSNGSNCTHAGGQCQQKSCQ